MNRTILAGWCNWMVPGLVAALAMMPAMGALRVWDGGGADDYLSTAANWQGDVAPVSGDVLVFRGNVRTSPVNDYDPATTVFETIAFENDSSTTALEASFTLSGNPITLTGGTTYNLGASSQQKGYAVFVMGATANKPLTDTLDLEITLSQNAAGNSKIGGYNKSNHHLVFRRAVHGNGGNLNSADQMGGNATYEGPVTGFACVQRPNGNGQVWLKSSANAFSSANPKHLLREGSLKFDSADAVGGSGTGFEFGQPNYDTPGLLYVNSAVDTEFTGALKISGSNYRRGAGQLLNEVAGTTASFLGSITVQTGHSTYNNSEGLGTGITLGNAGDGVLEGDIAAPQTWLYKQGAGTWTLAGNSAATGTVAVSAGTLLVNGDWSSTEQSKVSASARLGGTGRLGAVSFATGSHLAVTNLLGGTAFHVAKLDAAGMVTVDLLDAALPGAGTYTILTFDENVGTGAFILGAGWPEGTAFALGANALTVTLPAGLRTWTGAVSDAWDFTSANWTAGLFSDGEAVVFGDTATRTDVTVAQEVRPSSITVNGTKDWAFTGSAIAGTASLDKNGSGRLVLANANTYTGDTTINGGALQLDGSLAGGTLRIGPNATFTNGAAGRLTGACAFVGEGTMELNGVNDCAGGVTLKGLATVATPQALGVGDLTLGGTKQITIANGGEAIGRGRTLYTVYTDGNESHPFRLNAGAFTWLGDVRIRNNRLFVYAGSGTATFNFGEPGCTTTMTTEGIAEGGGGFYLRGAGVAHFYSRVDLGEADCAQTDGNSLYIHSSGNRWRQLTILVGKVFCRAQDALAWGTVVMGQTYQNYSFAPVLDLGGYDQTIKALVMNNCISTSSQTVKSDAPATLTISNDMDTVTARMQCRIQGAVSLRKDGAGTWSLGAQNLTTGNVEVVNGTLKLTASDALPAGRESTLTIASGAKIALDTDVQASIAYATVDGHPLKAGVYCGEGGTGTRLDAYIGPGAGSLVVTRGVNGVTIIVR